MDLRRFFNTKTDQTPTQTSRKSSAIPMLNQVMSATKGATNAFSGVSKHVNTSLKKLGGSNIQASIEYGIGFGHGFGVGLSMRSGVLNQIQSHPLVAMTKMMMKFGLIPIVPFSRDALPASSKSAKSTVTTDQISAGSMMQLATKSINQIAQCLAGSQPMKIDSAFENKALKGAAVDSASDRQTEKVVSDFPQNPSLKGDGGGLDEAAGRMQPDNKLLKTVLKQRQIIEQLVEENEKLRQMLRLVEDLKIPSSKLQASSSDSNLRTFTPSEVQDKDKITGGSRPPGDADGMC